MAVEPSTAPLPVSPERNCPVVNWDVGEPRPVLTYFDELDRLRETSPIVWNDYASGFWMLMSQDLVREAFQTPEVFCSDATIFTAPEPNWHWIPTMENPPQHTLYRHVLNPPFSPRAVKALESEVRRAAVETISAFKDRGSCDFVPEFATRFSTRVFLVLLGLPEAHTDRFVDWVEAIFAGFGGGEEAVAAMTTAQQDSHQYFVDLLEQVKREPRGEGDFFTMLLNSQVGDRPITDEEFVNIADVLLLAGLDTVKSQLGYMFFHLSGHPEHRHRIIAEPSVIPGAVEEYVRAYSIVMDGRKVKQDTDFHGCPMKKGDMVMLSIPSASRDPQEFPDPGAIDFERSVNRHVAFAAGPHRCLGAHLARLELGVALDEWHKLIPDYRALDTDALRETGPQLGLDSLQLTWEVSS
jgi:cytochrome P450